MAKDTEYNKLDENALVKHAKRVRKIENLEERVEEGHKLLTGFLSSPLVGSKYHKKSLDISDKDLSDLAKSAHKKFAAKAKEGKYLNYNEQMDTFKELANIVGPHMYIGTKNAKADSEEWEQNWKQLETYLGNVKTGEKGNAMDQVRAALKNGDVHMAKQIIVNSLKSHYKQRDTQAFMDELIPPDDTDYHVELAKPLAKAYTKELKAAGIKKKITEHSVAEKIQATYLERAQHAKEQKEKYNAVKD